MKPFTLRKRRKKENGPVPQIAINQTTLMSILQYIDLYILNDNAWKSMERILILKFLQY